MSCENCEKLAEQNHALQERAISEHEKREALIDELVELRRKNGGLRGKLAKMEKVDAPEAVVAFCFARWADGQPGTPTLGPKRAELLGRAINAKWGGRDRVLKAIRGASRYPYVVNAQRRGVGRDEERHDGLALILRDEEQLEKFCKLANRADVADGFRVGRPEVCERLSSRFGADQVVPLMDEFVVDRSEPQWWAPCPSCGAKEWTAAPLAVTWGERGKGKLKCLRGCSERDVWDALALPDHSAQQELAA